MENKNGSSEIEPRKQSELEPRKRSEIEPRKQSEIEPRKRSKMEINASRATVRVTREKEDKRRIHQTNLTRCTSSKQQCRSESE